MFFELRQYRIKDGQREAWVRLMEDRIIPFQQSLGMVVIGSFVAPEEPDLYVWIRRFASEDERKAQYDAVYGSEHWKTVIKPEIDRMLDRPRMVVTLLQATPKSAIA
jgi:hypothetical protein